MGLAGSSNTRQTKKMVKNKVKVNIITSKWLTLNLVVGGCVHKDSYHTHPVRKYSNIVMLFVGWWWGGSGGGGVLYTYKLAHYSSTIPVT